MDAVTRAVQAMYAAFPYPSGAPKLRQGADPRLLASYAQSSRGGSRPLRVLDAGCGRGVGLLGAASVAPEVEFTGIDLCRPSLDHVASEVERRGLTNVRLAEVDLMTLDGLEVPPEGFDVVLSSGVVHHLSDPAQGLARLRDVLAPEGVLSLMVYGRRGRESLYRLVRAVDALCPRELPLVDRLAQARALVAGTHSEILDAGPWDDLETIDDTEFVDRYLNVNETSYDVPTLFELIGTAGLQFLRWVEPRDWSVDALSPTDALRARLEALAPERRFELIDELCWRPSLELVAVGPRARAREATGREDEWLAWSPEATLSVTRRPLASGERVEQVELQVRTRERSPLPTDGTAQVALLLERQSTPFARRELLGEAVHNGLSHEAANTAIDALLAEEALYRPHAADVARMQ